MHLFDSNGKRYTARKVVRPRFSHHRGRTWDSETKIIDGAEYKFMVDTTWGFRFYFQHGQAWYAMHHWKDNEGDATCVRTFFSARPQSQ